MLSLQILAGKSRQSPVYFPPCKNLLSFFRGVTLFPCTTRSLVSVAEPIDISPEQSSARVASGSSFYAAMRILPPAQREGMFEIYAFCRAVDDIADDGEDTSASRMSRLAAWRRDLADLYDGRPAPSLVKLARVVKQFGLKHEDFLAVIEGMEMDACGPIVAPDLVTLDLYCDRVASAVGRLSVKVFGMPEQDGIDLSYHLGRALQLTNILRDIDEDAGIGRVYLPRETLADAGLVGATPEMVVAAKLDRACAPLVTQAREHYAKARAIMVRHPRRRVVAPAVMAKAYGAILDKLVARGFAVPRERVRVPRWRLILMLLRQMAF
ncbi:All-trans-phytoene synthase [Pandoraea horticolens]|uniref:All-trans-phytoene synthase n=1 Tax=Pandoraea horticolens TaxID=2508298 RepID=A0A5E4VID5_9BURK|nr:All-trans-phytoene synthase [Pandoraea horticolens]